jgi:hypothetical protein
MQKHMDQDDMVGMGLLMNAVKKADESSVVQCPS